MAASMREALQLQLDEFECVLSMFPEEREMSYDAELKNQYAAFLTANDDPDGVATLPKLEYTIRFVHLLLDGQVPELEIAYPREYPVSANVRFVVRCASLPRTRMEELYTQLLCLATGNDGEMVVLQLYQCMADLLQDVIAEQAREEEEDAAEAMERLSLSNAARASSTPTVLGRRAIYFHHIIASTKRRVVKEWALELALGGFSKIGWPGVVIVEGDERDAQEYVRRLQHLRWKQMVVRGEQTEPVSGSLSLDELRRLPRAFCEFPETAMSEAATLCRDAGLEELFLSVMKIYRAEITASEDGHKSEGDSGNKQTKTKKR